MKKITTLFKKDPTNLGRVINEVHPDNTWVFTEGAIATRKYDGTACAIIGGELYKRFDLKKGRTLPPNAIPCQEPDEITGHHPHWVKCERTDPSCKYHFEAFDRLEDHVDGTYELCGERIQGNPEKINGHELIPHGADVISLFELDTYTFDGIRSYLESPDIEGIVFHDRKGDRMCKIRKSDFGLKR
jgi:hypothetical protein